jgi:hypothetical protein
MVVVWFVVILVLKEMIREDFARILFNGEMIGSTSHSMRGAV